MNAPPIPALSIRQPWAWLIVNGHKPVENRRWETRWRGPLLIHASKSLVQDDFNAVRQVISENNLHIELPTWPNLECGGIVGSVDLVDCVDRMESPWFAGPWGFVLANPQRMKFIPCRGRLGLFLPEPTPPAPRLDHSPELGL